MISVIIPTMWKAPHLKKMLPMLEKHPLIGEIILIDNDPQKTDHTLLNQISKLVYFSFENGNIFVNPAWNHGVWASKYDKLFFLNDDCIVNLFNLEFIYNRIVPDRGILGFSASSYCIYTIDAYEILANAGFGENLKLTAANPADFKQTTGMPHVSYGSAMFLHKDNYRVIPNDFRIYYGDLFLYINNLKNEIGNYIIENGLVLTKPSTTVSQMASEIVMHEAKILKEKFALLGLTQIKYQFKDVSV